MQGSFTPTEMFDILAKRFPGSLRASPRTKRSATRTKRAQSPSSDLQLNLTRRTLILKNSEYFPSLNVQDWHLFFSRPIGVPLLRKVTIHNINGHSSIQMLSISGNTFHFHCSFFNDKVSLLISRTSHPQPVDHAGNPSRREHNVRRCVPRSGGWPRGEHVVHPHQRWQLSIYRRGHRHP